MRSASIPRPPPPARRRPRTLRTSSDADGSLGDALVELQALTRRLRRDCPWDREQTARTIVPHTVEEAYEVAVNVLRRLNVDPELALRGATARFVSRVEAAERLAAQAGREFAKLPLDEQDRFFDLAKETE
jgi:uncharacterized protein YabN with tetrapyrrole methylase and pyrophosphatase domain